jgi:hypothetical protein
MREYLEPKVARYISFKEVRVKVRRNDLAVGRNALGEPNGNRSSTRANLEATPTGTNAQSR